MKTPPVRQLLQLCAGGVLLVGGLAAAEPAVTLTPTVKLDTVVVSVTPDYQPIEDGWQVGQVPGFMIFSHGNAAATRVAEALQLARAAFGLVWKDEALLRRPMTVVVTADEPEFLRWSKIAPVAMDRTTAVVVTPAGPILLLNGGNEAVHRAAGRGYVLAQLGATRLPRWFQEGLAQVVNSAEAEGDRLRIGRVQQDERNQVSLDALRETAQALQQSRPVGGNQFSQIGSDGTPRVTNTRGDAIDIRINGMVPTWDELQRQLDEETRRRMAERDNYVPTADFLSFLGDNMVMDLDRILDPATPDTVAWRMNAWGFTHYSLFADRQKHQEAFFKFVRQLEREPARPPAGVFKEVFGVSPGKYELNLSLYTKGARYQIFDFKLAEPFKAANPGLAAVPETNVLQLHARVLAATDRAEEARQLLTRGYASSANRTASFVSQFVALERAHDPARAAELLEDAARREQLDNAGRRMLASARLDRLQRGGGKLASDELSMVLMPLFTALNQGDQSEELFVLIGKAWAASAVRPKPEHLNALRMGLAYYPKSAQLAELLKQLEHS